MKYFCMCGVCIILHYYIKIKCEIRFLSKYVYYYLYQKYEDLWWQYVFTINIIGHSNGFFSHLNTINNFQILFLTYYL